jgi:hypothetical protein
LNDLLKIKIKSQKGGTGPVGGGRKYGKGEYGANTVYTCI